MFTQLFVGTDVGAANMENIITIKNRLTIMGNSHKTIKNTCVCTKNKNKTKKTKTKRQNL